MTLSKEAATSEVIEAPDPADLSELFSALGFATDALRKSHDELLNRVKDLERELDQKNRALERKHRLEALGKIAAGVAHEIRNPLGSFSLYVDLLENELPTTRRAEEIFDRMRRGVTLLSNTVNDILTFTEPGTAHTVTYDPAGLLREALSLTACETNGRITCVTEFPEERRQASGDPDWLRRIFVNILLNACQAMPEGGRLSVSLSYEDVIFVRIGDTGPGIAPDDLEKVFLPFWGKRDGGTGLGLSIVHSLVERHQGAIELANRPEGGLEATVTVPWELKNEAE